MEGALLASEAPNIPSKSRRVIALIGLTIGACAVMSARSDFSRTTTPLAAFVLKQRGVASEPGTVSNGDWSVTVDASACGAMTECVVSISAWLTSASASSSTAGRFVLAYSPTDSSGRAVYSKMYEVESGSSVDATLFRLVAKTKYKVEVFMLVDGVISRIYSTHVKISKTGYDVFDAGGLVNITGNATWEMLLFPYMDDDSDFRGMVAVDADGDVVWFYNRGQTEATAHLEAFSQFEDEENYCVNDASGDGAVLVFGADGAVQSTLTRSDVEVVSSGEKDGKPLFDWGFMGHECRAVDSLVLLTGYAVQYDEDMHLEIDNVHYNNVALEWVAIWDPWSTSEGGGAAIKDMVWVADYVSMEEVLESKSASGGNGAIVLEQGTCGELDDECNGFFLMLFHISAVSVSPDKELLIITLRNIHTVIAVNITSKELVWQFSSALLKTDFALAEEDKFYDPHDSILTEMDGKERLCLMDEGYFREGCEIESLKVDYYCYSRGACYDLDHANGVASRVYSFAYPTNTFGDTTDLDVSHADIFNDNGGSVVKIPSQLGDETRMLTAFTSVYKENFDTHSYAFETDVNANLKSIALLPHIESWETGSSGGSSGMYRILPIITISGEKSSPPSGWEDISRLETLDVYDLDDDDDSIQ